MNNGLVIHRFVEISKLSMLTRHQKTYLATGLQMLQVIEKKRGKYGFAQKRAVLIYYY